MDKELRRIIGGELELDFKEIISDVNGDFSAGFQNKVGLLVEELA